MTTVFVSYSERSHGGEKIDPSDRWSDREDTVTEFQIEGLSLYRPDTPYYSAFELDIPEGTQEVFVIHVRYSTGDTFGRETGRAKITDVVLTQADAERILDSIEDGSHADASYWTGYFERLESCHADAFPLRAGSKSLHRIHR